MEQKSAKKALCMFWGYAKGGFMESMIQYAVFVGLTLLVAALTYWHCRKSQNGSGQQGGDAVKEVFLANGGCRGALLQARLR